MASASAPTPPQQAPQGEPEHLPHGLKGLVAYDRSLTSSPWFWAALISFLGLVFYFLYKKYLEKKRASISIPMRDPVQECFEQLKKMYPEPPFVGPDQPQYFFELNLKLREFIEAITHIRATDLTLKELREPLRTKLPMARTEVEEMLTFFERSEQIKFAQAPTSMQEASSFHEKSVMWAQFLLRNKNDANTTAVIPSEAEGTTDTKQDNSRSLDSPSAPSR